MYCSCDIVDFHKIHKFKYPLAIFLLASILFKREPLSYKNYCDYASKLYISPFHCRTAKRKIYRLLLNHPHLFTPLSYDSFHTNFTHFNDHFYYKDFLFPPNLNFTNIIYLLQTISDSEMDSEIFAESSDESEIVSSSSVRHLPPSTSASLALPSVSSNLPRSPIAVFPNLSRSTSASFNLPPSPITNSLNLPPSPTAAPPDLPAESSDESEIVLPPATSASLALPSVSLNLPPSPTAAPPDLPVARQPSPPLSRPRNRRSRHPISSHSTVPYNLRSHDSHLLPICPRARIRYNLRPHPHKYFL